MQRSLILTAAAAAIALLVLSGKSDVDRARAVPTNDNLAAATLISFQPYTDSVDTTGATEEAGAGETTSYSGCQGQDPGAYVLGKTVWYKYPAGAVGTLQVDSIGSKFDVVIQVYTGPASSPTFAGLTYVTCGDQEFGTADAGLTFSPAATTYYFQVGGWAGAGGPPSNAAEGLLVLNVSHVVSTAGADYTVNSTLDSGDATPEGACDDGFGNCTLREAIQEANASAGTDNIFFGIGGTPTVAPGSDLPTVTDPVNIDARTELAFAGTPVVRLQGGPGRFYGITLSAANSSLRGLVVTDYTYSGILSTANNNIIQGNYVGTNVAGTAAVANGAGGYPGVYLSDNSGNTVGGTTAAARNLISGNGGSGIFVLRSSSNRILGNYIGTDAAGSADLGNGSNGIEIWDGAGGSATGNLIGGGPAERRNVISGNGSAGLLISGIGSSGNVVHGNYIGTAADGTTALGNTGDGVRIDSAVDNILDTTGSGPGSDPHNLIKENGGAGVYLTGSANHNFIFSEITANGGLGIDLAPAGVTPNDAGDPDTGPQGLQNYPVIISAYTVGGDTYIDATLNSTASGAFIISFYSNASCDGTNGEGRTYLSSSVIVTGPTGNGSGSNGFGLTAAVGEYVTATASSGPGGTSEFSVCMAVTGDDLDDDNDGVYDVDEANCDGSSLNAALRPERLDGVFAGVSDDGDLAIDEALPGGSAAFDCDGDGWKGNQENLIFNDAPGTGRDQDPCGNNGWPADLDPDNKLNIGDINSVTTPSRPSADHNYSDSHGAFNKFGHPLDDANNGTGLPPPDGIVDPLMARWNLDNPPHVAGTTIDIGDLNAVNPGVAASTARPPMFGGLPAFFTNGGQCPYAP